MSFDFGRVVRRTFQPLKTNPLTFFGLALILVGLPAVVLGYLQQQATLDMLQGLDGVDEDDPAAVFGTMGGAFGWTLVGLLVSLVTTALLQGSLIHAAVADYRGRKAAIGESLSTGLRHLVPLVVISILFGLAVTFGLILLVIPGLFILVKWLMAVPAEVAENTGIGGAFGRSWQLTKGRWWPIFGLLILYAILAYAVQLLLAIPLGTMGAFTGTDPVAAVEAATSPLALLIQAISGSITGAIAAAGVAAIYYELRQDKDGVGVEDLSDVFA